MGQNNLSSLWTMSSRKKSTLTPSTSSTPVHSNQSCTVCWEAVLSSPKSAFILLLWNPQNRFLSLSHVCGVCHSLQLPVSWKYSSDFWRCSQLSSSLPKAILRSSLCLGYQLTSLRNDLFCPQCFQSPAHIPSERSFLPQECKPAVSALPEHAGAPVGPGRAHASSPSCRAYGAAADCPGSISAGPAQPLPRSFPLPTGLSVPQLVINCSL